MPFTDLEALSVEISKNPTEKNPLLSQFKDKFKTESHKKYSGGILRSSLPNDFYIGLIFLYSHLETNEFKTYLNSFKLKLAPFDNSLFESFKNIGSSTSTIQFEKKHTDKQNVISWLIAENNYLQDRKNLVGYVESMLAINLFSDLVTKGFIQNKFIENINANEYADNTDCVKAKALAFNFAFKYTGNNADFDQAVDMCSNLDTTVLSSDPRLTLIAQIYTYENARTLLPEYTVPNLKTYVDKWLACAYQNGNLFAGFEQAELLKAPPGNDTYEAKLQEIAEKALAVTGKKLQEAAIALSLIGPKLSQPVLTSNYSALQDPKAIKISELRHNWIQQYRETETSVNKLLSIAFDGYKIGEQILTLTVTEELTFIDSLLNQYPLDSSLHAKIAMAYFKKYEDQSNPEEKIRTFKLAFQHFISWIQSVQLQCSSESDIQYLDLMTKLLTEQANLVNANQFIDSEKTDPVFRFIGYANQKLALLEGKNLDKVDIDFISKIIHTACFCASSEFTPLDRDVLFNLVNYAIQIIEHQWRHLLTLKDFKEIFSAFLSKLDITKRAFKLDGQSNIRDLLINTWDTLTKSKAQLFELHKYLQIKDDDKIVDDYFSNRYPNHVDNNKAEKVLFTALLFLHVIQHGLKHKDNLKDLHSRMQFCDTRLVNTFFFNDLTYAAHYQNDSYSLYVLGYLCSINTRDCFDNLGGRPSVAEIFLRRNYSSSLKYNDNYYLYYAALADTHIGYIKPLVLENLQEAATEKFADNNVARSFHIIEARFLQGVIQAQPGQTNTCSLIRDDEINIFKPWTASNLIDLLQRILKLPNTFIKPNIEETPLALFKKNPNDPNTLQKICERIWILETILCTAKQIEVLMTSVIDTADKGWTLLQIAEYQKLNHEFTELNEAMRSHHSSNQNTSIALPSAPGLDGSEQINDLLPPEKPLTSESAKKQVSATTSFFVKSGAHVVRSDERKANRKKIFDPQERLAKSTTCMVTVPVNVQIQLPVTVKQYRKQ